MLAHKHSCTHLLSSMAGTGTDGTQVFLLPLVSNLVHFAIIVTRRLICGERGRFCISELIQQYFKFILSSARHNRNECEVKYNGNYNFNNVIWEWKLFWSRIIYCHPMSNTWRLVCKCAGLVIWVWVWTYEVHTWTLPCHCPGRYSSSCGRFQRGGPTSRQCGSYCRYRGTTLRVGGQWQTEREGKD